MNHDQLRTAALLHDIGKPMCWSRGGKWSDHIYDTYQLVKEILGEEAALRAMRHHTGSSYDEKYHPHSPEEWIIWISDKISSGLDRKEETEEFSWKPSPPYRLSHPLSGGEKNLVTYSSQKLKQSAINLTMKLRQVPADPTINPAKQYSDIYKILEDSILTSVPADTRAPINDVSLWLHSKLTAAIATCIALDEGWKGAEPQKYTFALLSGDGDTISKFISESKRIPDLNARSRKVTEATQRMADIIRDELGPECLIFEGGGSIFALTPRPKVDSLSGVCSEAFTETMKGVLTCTFSVIQSRGDELLKDFGRVWAKAGRGIRNAKLDKPVTLGHLPPSEEKMCDVCGVREAVYEDQMRTLPVNASPRAERLCPICWRLREEGHGVWMQSLEDSSGLIAIIKADGDGMGDALMGKTLVKLGKTMTPGRLTSLSELINKTCQQTLRDVVESYGGRVVYAGGDDLLAVLPGENALDASIHLSQTFREEMNNHLTLSAGVVIQPPRMPLYYALDSVYRMISLAKSQPNKNSVAFTVMSGLGDPSESIAPIGWGELDELLETVSYLNRCGLPKSQLRRLSIASRKNPVEASALLKNLVGRGIIDEGEKILKYVEDGRLSDAFTLYNLFKEKEKLE